MGKQITEQTPAGKKPRSKAQKWSRRGFITAGVLAGGALVVGVAIRPGHRGPKLAKYVADDGETVLTGFVKIAPDNTVTAIVPHVEMGQGVLTALGAMLAEEMDVDWEKLDVVEAPAEKDYASFVAGREFMLGDKKVPGFVQDTINGAFMKLTGAINLQITGGSLSVRYTGAGGMQIAGAAARDLIVEAAAKIWDVPAKSLRTQKSRVYHDASGRSAPYADFAVEAGKHKPSSRPKLKSRKDYSLMGTSLPRRDIPAKVDGTANFGIDAVIPGMKYAAVKAAPVFGASVVNADTISGKAMPGVIDVLNMGSYVAVVAAGWWAAQQAIDAMDIKFSKTDNDAVSQADIFAGYDKALDDVAAGGKSKSLHKSGNLKKAFEGASEIFKARYSVPYLAHACMEPMNATAWVRDGKCDVWTGTQNPLGTRAAVAKILDTDLDNVTLHNQFLGGGFGRRAMTDYFVQAVEVAQKSGHPVKLIWSREETTQHDFYRPAVASRFKIGLDKDGLPVAWDHIFTHKMDPVESSLPCYNVGALKAHYVDGPAHVPLGPWRSVDHTQHGFFIESVVDELAAKAGMDGYAYRRKLLAAKPRFLNVLDRAAKLGKWNEKLPAGQAKGIAIMESFGTIVAEVLTVDMSEGTPKVLHVACAADAGMAVNPDGFRAQMESGIIYGLTAALFGKISIEDGAVMQSNFHDYEMIRMDNAPAIDVDIIISDAKLGGAGEPGTPPVTPALTNAIFNATGKRLRSLPVSDFDFTKTG